MRLFPIIIILFELSINSWTSDPPEVVPCPLDLFQFNHRLQMNQFECTNDQGCPSGFVCCNSRGFLHKICQPSTGNKEYKRYYEDTSKKLFRIPSAMDQQPLPPVCLPPSDYLCLPNIIDCCDNLSSTECSTEVPSAEDRKNEKECKKKCTCCEDSTSTCSKTSTTSSTTSSTTISTNIISVEPKNREKIRIKLPIAMPPRVVTNDEDGTTKLVLEAYVKAVSHPELKLLYCFISEPYCLNLKMADDDSEIESSTISSTSSTLSQSTSKKRGTTKKRIKTTSPKSTTTEEILSTTKSTTGGTESSTYIPTDDEDFFSSGSGSGDSFKPDLEKETIDDGTTEIQLETFETEMTTRSSTKLKRSTFNPEDIESSTINSTSLTLPYTTSKKRNTTKKNRGSTTKKRIKTTSPKSTSSGTPSRTYMTTEDDEDLSSNGSGSGDLLSPNIISSTSKVLTSTTTKTLGTTKKSPNSTRKVRPIVTTVKSTTPDNRNNSSKKTTRKDDKIKKSSTTTTQSSTDLPSDDQELDSSGLGSGDLETNEMEKDPKSSTQIKTSGTTTTITNKKTDTTIESSTFTSEDIEDSSPQESIEDFTSNESGSAVPSSDGTEDDSTIIRRRFIITNNDEFEFHETINDMPEYKEEINQDHSQYHLVVPPTTSSVNPIVLAPKQCTPSDFYCLMQFDVKLTSPMRCRQDGDCQKGLQCCQHRCFGHLVCATV